MTKELEKSKKQSGDSHVKLIERQENNVWLQISTEQRENLINKTKTAFKIVERITGVQSPLYLAGGTIRDILLNETRESCDYDFLGDFSLDQIQRNFPDLVVGRWNEVSTIKLRVGSWFFDFISTKDVKETLGTWDITVSTMCLEDNGEFYDNFSGFESLYKREIKILDPKTKFSTDPCRILRVFRLAEELGFEIEDATLKVAIECGYLLKNVDYKDDLKKILSLDYYKKMKVLDNLCQNGIGQYLSYEGENEPTVMETILLEEKIKALAPISEIIDLFPVEIYLIGGATRNMVLNKKIKDFDFKVHLPFQEMLNSLAVHGFVETTNLNLTENQYYVNDQARSISLFINDCDVDIAEMATTDITEIIKDGDINFNCCFFNVNSGKIENPEVIEQIKKKEIYFCDPEGALNDPLKVINALKQISRLPEIVIPMQTREIISKSIPAIVDYLLIHPKMKYKIKSICGHLNDAEVYSFFDEDPRSGEIFEGVEINRDMLSVTSLEYISETIEHISEQNRLKIITLIKTSYGDSCDDDKIFCQNVNSVVYKKDANGRMISCCLVDKERLYAIAAINGVEWSNIIKELVKSNYNVWLTADSGNQKVLALCLVSGFKMETAPLIMDKILKSKYAKYDKSIEIYIKDRMLVFKKRDSENYPQVLLKS